MIKLSSEKEKQVVNSVTLFSNVIKMSDCYF